MENNHTLYIKDAKGQLRYWSIDEDLDGFTIKHGVIGGSPTEKFIEVPCGKASRTHDEQIHSEIMSRVNKRLDKGYVYDIHKATVEKATNSLGLCKPMLATAHKKVTAEYLTVGLTFVQRKYDGNRCLIYNNGEETIAYTRNGKLFTTLDHILDDIEVPVGMTIDGEIYCHGEALQTIVSWAKRKQANTKKLVFMAYDVIVDMPFIDRLAILNNLVIGDSIQIADTLTYNSTLDWEMVNALTSDVIEDGYEGLIVRKNGHRYDDGKRSKNLIKVKRWESKEFTVVGIYSSSDGWAILECIHNTKKFRVSAPGAIADKVHVLNNPDMYIGEKVTVEYSAITQGGIPFHPVAVAFRNYE